MILYVKHVAIEGPETLGDFFAQQGFRSQTIDLWSGDSLPVDIAKFQAIVVLGGPMNVYEEEKYLFLRAEDFFIKKVVASGIPFLGLCLGAQLLAKAGGAKVGKSPQKEIGFFDVRLTKAGKKDFLFQGVGDTIKAFQWHEDAFAIPSGAENLASSVGCPHQAFRLGPNAYGLQFHVEIKEETIVAWMKTSNPDEAKRLSLSCETMIQEYRQIKASFDGVALQIYRNFLALINKRRLCRA